MSQAEKALLSLENALKAVATGEFDSSCPKIDRCLTFLFAEAASFRAFFCWILKSMQAAAESPGAASPAPPLSGVTNFEVITAFLSGNLEDRLSPHLVQGSGAEESEEKENNKPSGGGREVREKSNKEHWKQS